MRWMAMLALAVAIAGCGDDDATPRVADDDVPFCDAYDALLGGPLADIATDAGDPDVLRDAVESSRGLLAAFVEAAPAEIDAVVTGLATDYEATFAVLERHGYDLDRVRAEATPAEQAVLDDFGDTAGAGAVDPFAELQRFVATRCAPEVTLPPELTTSP